MLLPAECLSTDNQDACKTLTRNISGVSVMNSKPIFLDCFYTSGKRIIALGQGQKFIITCCFVYLRR